MTAYVISDMLVGKPEATKTYRGRVASMSLDGGGYLAHVGMIERPEGGWKADTIIVLDFPDMKRARPWYDSPNCASAPAIRDEAVSRDLIVAESIDATL
jgi:uncharacterized protein (DUF1330 family)